MIATEKVVPYAKNPRKNESAIAKVAASIQQFGWRQPIVVDSEMVVIAGHTRLQAAILLDHPKVPVHVAKGMTAEDVKAYRLADNRLAQDAEWDDELLGIELEELQLANYDMSQTGFEDEEIARAIAGEMEKIEDGVAEERDGDPNALAGTNFSFGQYRFSVSREEYLAWQEILREEVGFDDAAALAELRTRLGL
jgi:ParB-like chromosome segregation protein Spo0J